MSLSTMYPNLSIGEFLDASIEYTSDLSGFKNEVLTLPVCVMQWMKAGGATLSPQASQVYKGLRNTKQITASATMLHILRKFKNHTYELLCGNDRRSAATNTFFDAMEMVSPVQNLMEYGVSQGVLHVDPETFTRIQLIGAFSLTVGAGRFAERAKEAISRADVEIVSSRTSEERLRGEANKIKSWVDLLRNITYIAMGIISLIGIAFQIIFPVLLTLGLSSSALALSLFSYYHQRLSVLHAV